MKVRNPSDSSNYESSCAQPRIQVKMNVSFLEKNIFIYQSKIFQEKLNNNLTSDTNTYETRKTHKIISRNLPFLLKFNGTR